MRGKELVIVLAALACGGCSCNTVLQGHSFSFGHDAPAVSPPLTPPPASLPPPSEMWSGVEGEQAKQGALKEKDLQLIRKAALEKLKMKKQESKKDVKLKATGLFKVP